MLIHEYEKLQFVAVQCVFKNFEEDTSIVYSVGECDDLCSLSYLSLISADVIGCDSLPCTKVSN